VLNLGAGQGHCVRKVLAMIERATGRRPGAPSPLVADPGLARERLDFPPSRSDLRTIICSAWRWRQRARPRRASALSALADAGREPSEILDRL
jgi:UDP-glucose 4-epimerase